MTCNHCGHDLQFDPRLFAMTCFCGIQVYSNVHQVKHYACQRCGKDLMSIKKTRTVCNDCLNLARRQRNTDSRERYRRQAGDAA